MLSGFLIFLYWVPYNIAHFKLTPKENTGRSAAIMFSIGPIISILLPPAAGFLAEVNIDMVWIFTIGFGIMTFFLINFQSEFKINYSISAALKAVEKVRIFIFLEGIWEAIAFAVVPVYTLFFINTPLNYGIFLSYLGLISVFANLILGHISDRKQKRAIFLYPVTIFLAVITFLLAFAEESLALWIIISGAIAFVLPAFGTLTLSLFIDNQNNLEISFPGRELLLAVARTIGIGITFLAFLSKFETLLYIMLGFVMLLFPIVLFYRTKVSKKFSYL
jgi:MFS family permease